MKIEMYKDPVNGQLLFAEKDDPARVDPTTGAIFPAGCDRVGTITLHPFPVSFLPADESVPSRSRRSPGDQAYKSRVTGKP